MVVKIVNFVVSIQQYCDECVYEVSILYIGFIFWVVFIKDCIMVVDQIDLVSMEKFKVLYYELLQCGVYFGFFGYEVGFVSVVYDEVVLVEVKIYICVVMDVVFGQL